MELQERVERDIVGALKSGETVTLATLRLAKAAAEKARVAKRAPLTNAEYQDVLSREANLRRDAIGIYEQAGRPDRVAEERAELAVLENYLPAQLTDAELRERIQQGVEEAGASGPGDLGRVMSLVMPAVKGRAEGGTVNRLVREALNQKNE